MNLKASFKKLKKRIASKAAMTLIETLVALLLLTLATGGVAVGIEFATREYTNSMISSESKLLYSTLQSVISNELTYTSTISYNPSGATLAVDGKSGFKAVEGMYFPTYPIAQVGANDGCNVIVKDAAFTVSVDGVNTNFGELCAGTPVYNLKLISSGAYTYNMGAAARIYYHPTEKFFRVRLMIGRENRDDLLVDTYFDVFPLNDLQVV